MSSADARKNPGLFQIDQLQPQKEFRCELIIFLLGHCVVMALFADTDVTSKEKLSAEVQEVLQHPGMQRTGCCPGFVCWHEGTPFSVSRQPLL